MQGLPGVLGVDGVATEERDQRLGDGRDLRALQRPDRRGRREASRLHLQVSEVCV